MRNVVDFLVDIATRPTPLRAILARKFLTRFPFGSYETRIRGSAVERPAYAFCLYEAARMAKQLGYHAITAVELGVAAGNGLVCLCKHKEEVEREFKIEVIVQGFDTGKGLPGVGDSRDLLYSWPPGSFEMDQAALKARIAGRAELLLGDVAQTVKEWTNRADAPLGAVLFDLDLYTSTRDALLLLEKPNVLPRVWCYMDDIFGFPDNAYSDSVGVRLALKEFNLKEERLRLKDHLSQAYVFGGQVAEPWHSQIYVYHRLTHPDYDRCLSTGKHRLALS
jgi:hypothetical protein